MTILYHPDFVGDIRRFATQYARVSPNVERRFREEVDAAIITIKANPTAAGHFINTGSVILTDVRRRNLGNFPFFMLYALAEDRLIFGSLIPSATDPLTWLERFA